VRAYVAEPRLTEVAPGTRVWIRADGSSEPLAGQVGFVSPKAEFTPRSVQTESLRTDLVYRLRIVVPAAGRGLPQGMPVTVSLQPPGRG
jgi:HlyD family secretion protein